MTIVSFWLTVKFLRKFNCVIDVLCIGCEVHVLVKYLVAFALLKSKVCFMYLYPRNFCALYHIKSNYC